ncbi:MAG TPA: response regulator, partial [Acidobacteriaceae bacterium]|nr:response regulator [Acidobacteriaceae bacterium]
MTQICLESIGSYALEETAQRRQQDAEDQRRRRRILCVDDDPVVLSLQRALLESAGFSVITARDGKEGLRRFSAEFPDAAVLDYAMPGMNGAALAAQMRRIAEDVPLILNSGSVTVSAEEARLFERVLSKGLAPGLLVRVLREIFPLLGAGAP